MSRKTTRRSTKRPAIKIHYGASHNDIEVDGNTFCLNDLAHGQRKFLRRTITEALERCGFVSANRATA